MILKIFLLRLVKSPMGQWVNIGPDDGLLLIQRQINNWTDADLMSTGLVVVKKQ